MIVYLEKFNNKLPLILQCKFNGCKYYKYHTIDAHYCELCNEKYHSENSCSFLINNNLEIICPICKKLNIINEKQQKIFGLSDQCVICMENPVEVYFPSCGHVCICIKCSNKIEKNANPDIYNDIRNEEILIKQNYDLEKIRKNLKPYPSYLYVYENNECYSIIRIKINNKLEGLFIDDSYNINKIIKKNNFIKGYALVNIESAIYHDWTSNINYNL
jgi:hypothetical protein